MEVNEVNWREGRMYVLEELKEIKSDIRCSRTEIAYLTVEVEKLKVRVALISAAAGGAMSAIFAGIKYLALGA